MESCLMKYFVLNTELKNSCECNPALFEEAPSLYEVIRVEDGIPLFLEDHIKRFFLSGKLYNKTVPVTERQIVSRIKALIEANGLVTGLIKFIYLNHPVAGNLFAAWVTPFFFPSNEMALHGVDTLTLSGERHKPNAKISHQTVRRQADEIIKTKGVYEVVLVNGNGVVTEGSRSNLFFVKHGILFTAHPKLILEGITRSKIVSLALNAGIDIFESEFKLDEIVDMEAAFITGTTPKVLPVRKIDARLFSVEHPVVKYLSESYNHLIRSYIDKFSW